MTVRELLSRMDAREIEEWRLLEQIDPWGQLRTDYLFASLCQVTLMPHLKKPMPLKDFLLSFEQKAEQSWQTIKALLKKACLAAGGKVIKPGKDNGNDIDAGS